MDRYLHMVSWAFIYTSFSAFLILIYRMLLRSKNGWLVIKYGRYRWQGIQGSDLVVYLIMTVVAAIRCNVGSDFYNYYVYFNAVNNRYDNLKEIIYGSPFNGYYALAYLIKVFTDNQYAIFSVIAIVVYACLFYTIRKESVDCEVSLACYLFLGFYANSLNILKQYIAMTFLLLTYFNYRHKKYLYTIILGVVSVVFHYSAIIALVIFFVFRKFEPKKIFTQAMIVWAIGIGMILPYLLSFLLRIIASASGYGKYLSWDRNNQIRLVLAVVGSCLVYGVLLFLIFKNRKKIREIDEVRYQEITLLIVGFVINIVGIRMWIITRISFYFYMLMIFVLPVYFQTLNEINRRKMKQLIYLLLILYSLFNCIFLGENEYYSYSTIFNTSPMTIKDYNYIYDFLK